MEDPFRPSVEPAPRRVIARRGNGALVFLLTLSLLGLATPVIAKVWAEEMPAMVVLMLIAFPMGLVGFGRSVHAWFLPHSIEIDANGLRFAWAEKITALPWLRRRDCELSWADLRGIRTNTFSVNGYSTTELVITTSDGSFEVPMERFDRSAELIQRDILDFIELSRERPVGATSAYAQRQRQRFATPVRLVAKPWVTIGTAALFLPLNAFMVYMAWAAPDAFTYGLAVVATVLFGGITVSSFSIWLNNRVLVLGPHGLALGRNEAQARRVPWEDIRTVRRTATNGTTSGIEIVLQDGSHVTLRFNYDFRLDEIAFMLGPVF